MLVTSRQQGWAGQRKGPSEGSSAGPGLGLSMASMPALPGAAGQGALHPAWGLRPPDLTQTSGFSIETPKCRPQHHSLTLHSRVRQTRAPLLRRPPEYGLGFTPCSEPPDSLRPPSTEKDLGWRHGVWRGILLCSATRGLSSPHPHIGTTQVQRDETHARQVCGLPWFETFVPHGDPGSPLTAPPAKRPVSRGTEPAQEPSGSPRSSLVARQVSGAQTCADPATSQETFYLKRRCLATRETDCVCLVPRKTSRKLSKGQILTR